MLYAMLHMLGVPWTCSVQCGMCWGCSGHALCNAARVGDVLGILCAMLHMLGVLYAMLHVL